MKRVINIRLKQLKVSNVFILLCLSILPFQGLFSQKQSIKKDLLSYMIANKKLFLGKDEQLEDFYDYLFVYEVVKKDYNWGRSSGIYCFGIHSESAPDLLIKEKDKYKILDPSKLDEMIESILKFGKSSSNQIKAEDLLLYIEYAIKIYRDNDYVRKERVIGVIRRDYINNLSFFSSKPVTSYREYKQVTSGSSFQNLDPKQEQFITADKISVSKLKLF